jgi:hypothetical protein
VWSWWREHRFCQPYFCQFSGAGNHSLRKVAPLIADTKVIIESSPRWTCVIIFTSDNVGSRTACQPYLLFEVFRQADRSV